MTSSAHKLFQAQSMNLGKRQRTRSALLDSAISIVATKGFEATKITDITTHAGLANGTFYNHFEDKEQLMHEVATGLAIEITRDIDEQMKTINNAATRIIVATATFLEVALREPEWVQVLIKSSDVIPEIQSNLVKYLKKDLELGFEQGHFKVAVDLLLVNQIIALTKVSLQLNRRRDKGITKKTCAGILRLLGISAAQANKLVGSALDT